MGIQSNFVKFHDKIKMTYESDDYSAAKLKDSSITTAVKEAFKTAGYPVIDNFIQGSFSTHTAIRSLIGDFDIDRAIVIDHDVAPENPVDPKNIVLDVLEKRGFSNARIKKPCVTADYKVEDLHIDFPIYKKSGSNYYLAVGKKGSDENNREWSNSDPKGLKDWIKDKSGYVGSADAKLQQFNRVVRYLKRWRDYKCSSAVAEKVYSIGLTVMAKKHFQPSFDAEGKPCDATALRNTAKRILDSNHFVFQGSEQYKVEAFIPVAPHRDIFDGSSLDTGTQLRNKLTKLVEKMDTALAESDEKKQCGTFQWLFGDDFAVPETSNSGSSEAKAVFGTSGSVGTSQGA